MRFGTLLRLSWRGALLALFVPFLAPLPATAQIQTNVPGPVLTNLPVPEVVAPGVTRVGILELYAITESSGLAASPRYTNVFWTHNDTESPAFLYAIDHRGGRIGAFEIKGANLIDFEALAFDEAGKLYFADIGTNGMVRSHSAIHRVEEEPDPFDRYGPVNVERTWYIRFPGEREDCESFFIDNGYAYLLSKAETNNMVNMYRFNLADRAESILVEFVAAVRVNNDLADAKLSRDKSRLALLTDEGVTIVFINGDISAINTAPRRSTDHLNANMEGVAFTGEGILVTTETTREVLLFHARELTGAPIMEATLTNRTVFVGGTVTFEIEVEGFPSPVIEWRFNGAIIPGATNATLTLTNISLADAGLYQVTVSNPAGVARSRAMLTVLERTVDLRITEVMSSEAVSTVDVEDWWELTNFGTGTNDLSGWRFNDSTGGLNDAFVIPAGTVIRPGESIVFVEQLSPEEFRIWWGETNVPPAVQVVTYEGSALSFNAVADSLRLWDDRATDDAAVFARADFGAADPGVSFTLDLVSGQLVKSQLGVNGAFQAAAAPDIGSPGLFATNTPAGLRIDATLKESQVELTASGTAESFQLEWTSDLGRGEWNPSGMVVHGTNAVSVPALPGADRRFYRLRKL